MLLLRFLQSSFVNWKIKIKLFSLTTLLKCYAIVNYYKSDSDL